MEVYYVDGEFVPKDQAVIPVNDLAILRGLGVFDLIRTLNGRPYFFKEHIDRLMQSARQTGLHLPWNQTQIEDIVLQTLEKNPHLSDANIRIVITGGSSTDFMTFQEQPRLIVLITPMKRYPSEWYEKGVKVITIQQERDLPDAKSISYISAALALKQAHDEKAIEALYVNRNTEVLEGTTSNLFALFNQTLVTPEAGILKGVTRQAVLNIARDLYAIEQRPIKLDELLQADEVFITGTNKGVVPVVQVDTTIINTGRPGKNTLTLLAHLTRHAEGFREQA
ncbi:MAG: branched-chain amino acid aminotransferase [Desulfobacteraceae bacterium]|nr:MAG: branched-chain amino acid aminotransferase [Desulfobacteraceae bacterium]